MKNYFMFFTLILFLLSCNCHTEGSGVVLDGKTKEPLENVKVSIHLSTIHDDSLKIPVLTDENGNYTLSHSYCSDYMIDFDKEGYIGFVTSPKKNDTIFLNINDNKNY